MSNRKSKIIEKIKLFWKNYEKQIVLFIGIILVAIFSFEVGFLEGKKLENNDTLVIEKAAEQKECVCDNAQAENPTNSSSQTATQEKTTDEKECVYVGSKNSNKYHLPTCQFAKRIKPENLVCFKSKEDAESKGYTACKCVK